MNLSARLDEVRREYLRRMTQGHGELLQQVEHFVTAHEGKMLRPQMTLQSAATLGEAHLLSRRTLLFAVCVEMIHNASLLHDDVIDRGQQRRGQPSVNAQWNNAIAVLVGDYLLVKIMELLNEVGDSEASCLINDTVKSMVEAELLQQQILRCSDVRKIQKSTYLKIIDGKTANLFATAAALGNPAYRDYGFHYGRLFQLRDDLADGEETPYTRSLIAQEEALLRTLPQLQ